MVGEVRLAVEAGQGSCSCGDELDHEELLANQVARLELSVNALNAIIVGADAKRKTGQAAATSILAARRTVNALLNFPALTASPAWDILLEIYAAGRLAVSNAAESGGCPQSTGLRWIAVLESKGLVNRFADERDARRKYLILSDRAARLVEDGLAAYEA